MANAGFGFYHHMEKHFKDSLHQGAINFAELSELSAVLFEKNIGSNEFHMELEQFILHNFTDQNLMTVVNLLKGMSLYHIKVPELEDKLLECIGTNLEDFTTNQLELVLWSLSRKHLAHHQALQGYKSKLDHYNEHHQLILRRLCKQVTQKSPSMKPRGIAFATESLCNLGYLDKESFEKIERVTLAKLDDFNHHYTVKMLSAFYKMGYGSNEFYD